MAYSVEQRTQEIGIRLALGAPAHQVKNMVVLQGMVLTLVGVVVGLGVGVRSCRASSRASSSASGARPAGLRRRPARADAPSRFVAVWLPARRASRIDPIIALRAE